MNRKWIQRVLFFLGGLLPALAAASVESSIQPQALGWWILAALAALVGLAVVGQALARQSIVESEDYPTMAALGASRRQLLALGFLRNLVVGLTGAVGSVVVAIALSPSLLSAKRALPKVRPALLLTLSSSRSEQSPRWWWCSHLVSGRLYGQRARCGPTTGRLLPAPQRSQVISQRWAHRRAR